jgi:hypothetical protein
LRGESPKVPLKNLMLQMGQRVTALSGCHSARRRKPTVCSTLFA